MWDEYYSHKKNEYHVSTGMLLEILRSEIKIPNLCFEIGKHPDGWRHLLVQDGVYSTTAFSMPQSMYELNNYEMLFNTAIFRLIDYDRNVVDGRVVMTILEYDIIFEVTGSEYVVYDTIQVLPATLSELNDDDVIFPWAYVAHKKSNLNSVD